MSGILNTGKIQTLLDRLTAVRAAFLDAAISTRAAASTALTNATWTDARAAKLDNLDAAVSSAGSKAPTALLGRVQSNTYLVGDFAQNGGALPGEPYSASTSTYDSWTTIHSVSSDSGVIEIMGAWCKANASNLNAQLRLTIDSTVVYTSDTDLWQAAPTSIYDDGVWLVGFNESSNGAAAFGNIPFTDNFTLEFKKTENSAGTVEIGGIIVYHTT